MNRIFINYRRDDALLYADRLQEVLSEHFGSDQVFRDLDTLEPGLDFVHAIDRALSQADVMLVVIGRHWLVSSDGRTRLQDPEDYVRLEVAGGLDRPNVRVIPVLVGGATMPASEDLPADVAPLTRRHAFEMTDTRWRYDRDELVRRLSKVLEAGAADASVGIPPPQPRANGAPGAEKASAPPPPPPPAPPAALGERDPDAAPPPPPPPSRFKNRRWIAAAGAAALLAIAIALGVFLVLGDGSSAISVPDVVGQTEEDAQAMLEREGLEVSSTRVADPGEEGLVLSQDPAAGTEADEGAAVTLEVSRSPTDALLAMVPSAIRSTCVEQESGDFPAIAMVACAGSDEVAVQYNLFADEGEMTEVFDASLEGVEEDLGRSIPDGSCSSDQFAQGSYSIDDTAAGRVFCYISEGDSWIEWVDSSLLVYSFALREGTRNDLLYRWWNRASGPVVPRQ